MLGGVAVEAPTGKRSDNVFLFDQESSMTAMTINAASTMQEVLAAYPSAQRGLFTRYHIGG